MRITFCLRDPDAGKPTPIHAYVHFNNRQLKIATGCSVLPKQWSKERRRVKRGAAGEAVTNAALVKMEADIRSIFAALEATGIEPTPELVRERYAETTGRVRPTAKPEDPLTVYKSWIDASTFADGTKRCHRKTRNHLEKFASADKIRLAFDRFDMIFWEKFARYLLTVAKMQTDSAWNIMKGLKAFLNAIDAKGIPVCGDFRRITRKSLPKGESSDKPFLTLEELDAVRALDLSDNQRLERVRDLFVFLCYTGMRFGDSQKLHPENVTRDTLRYVTAKNRKAVTVPLLEPAREVLAKYDGRLPIISNQKANAYLAEVLQAAGLTSPVHLVSYSGAERRERTLPKFDACGMHTAKRTFVSLLRQRRVSVEALMRATGNNRATLERYILRTDADAHEEIREAWK